MYPLPIFPQTKNHGFETHRGFFLWLKQQDFAFSITYPNVAALLSASFLLRSSPKFEKNCKLCNLPRFELMLSKKKSQQK